ncbi:hypothetical protein NECAME_00095, partial [Necator americanus]
MKPSTSVEKKGGPADFPDFSSMDAKCLGLLRRGHEEPSFLDTSKDHSSATGIRSSANLSSLKLQQSTSNELTVNTSSPRKKTKGSSSYKDLHSNYSPSPTPSPLSAHFKRAEQSTSRSESPSSRLTVTLPRKQDQKQPKITPTKVKKGFIPEMGTPSTSPMPRLENQSAAESVVQTQLEIHSARNSPAPKPPAQPAQHPIPDPPEAALALQSILLAHVKEEVTKEKKQREKKAKQKDKRKKLQEEQELLRKQEQEARERQLLAEQRLEKERAEQRQAEERARLHLLELARDTATPPMRQEVPEAQTPQMPLDARVPGATPSTIDPHYDNDSDTIPFFDDAVPAPTEKVPVPLETTFPLNISLDDSMSQHHKKKKKKDKEKERERSKSPHKKERKKDKEHKKKKKRKERDRSHEREDPDQGEQKQAKSSSSAKEPAHEPKFTLKIRIGDQTSTTETVTESSPQPETVKIKFKNFPTEEPKKEEPKTVPPLKLGSLSTHKEVKEEAAPPEPKRKFYTKAELKAPPPPFSSFSSDKHSKEERKRKKKEDEERKREKEERKRREKEDKRRLEQEREQELE